MITTISTVWRQSSQFQSPNRLIDKTLMKRDGERFSIMWSNIEGRNVRLLWMRSGRKFYLQIHWNNVFRYIFQGSSRSVRSNHKSFIKSLKYLTRHNLCQPHSQKIPFGSSKLPACAPEINSQISASRFKMAKWQSSLPAPSLPITYMIISMPVSF